MAEGGEPSKMCNMSQHDLHHLFTESDYGAKIKLFNAYFKAETSPPLCCVCDKPIGQHQRTVERISMTSTVESSQPALAEVAAPVEAEPQPFTMPPIPEHDDPANYHNKAPPTHWLGWRHLLVEIGEANAEGVKYRCRMAVANDAAGELQGPMSEAPEGRPCGVLIKENNLLALNSHTQGICPGDTDEFADTELGRHLALQHQIEKAPYPFAPGHGRPWEAPLCPCSDDCGTLCDCLFCPCCFCHRLDESLLLQQKLEVTYFITTAKTPGEPGGVACVGCCSACGQVVGAALVCLVFSTCIPTPCVICADDLDSCYHHRHRARILKRENIQESSCKRRCTSFCCVPCDLVQVHRELRAVGVDPGTTCCRSDPNLVRDRTDCGVQMADVFDANPQARRVEAMY